MHIKNLLCMSMHVLYICQIPVHQYKLNMTCECYTSSATVENVSVSYHTCLCVCFKVSIKCEVFCSHHWYILFYHFVCVCVLYVFNNTIRECYTVHKGAPHAGQNKSSKLCKAVAKVELWSFSPDTYNQLPWNTLVKLYNIHFCGVKCLNVAVTLQVYNVSDGTRSHMMLDFV